MNYWLIKSEPGAFSIDDLAKSPRKTTHWDGVRNYQARNMMRDQMRRGDQAFFYHSNCKPPGIVGIVEIVKEGYPDFTAFDPEDHHFDPKSDPDKPTWYMVDVKLKQTFNDMLSLDQIKAVPGLGDFALTRKGNRLSVMPVSAQQWHKLVKLASS